MDSVEVTRKHYAENFKPEDYRERIVDRDGGKMQKEEEFFFKSLAELFEENDLVGRTLLDIGSGPTVHNLAPACGRFGHIDLGEFNEDCRRELEKWLRGDDGALDWSRLLRGAARAQGYSDPEAGRLEIEKHIRNAVQSVYPCDVLSPHILPEDVTTTYDLVMTSLTLEAAAPDYETFKTCLKKIHRLLQPKGVLIMKGFLNGGPWRTGEQVFPYIKLSQTDIQNALEEAGFDNTCWKIFQRQDTDYSYEFDACYSLSCVKT